MSKRELHTYLYECDGYLVDGRKCIEDRRVEAFSPYDADLKITTHRPGLGTEWSFTALGWLCMRAHRGESAEENDERHVSAVCLAKEVNQIVRGDGRILRETEHWTVEWTESRDGWVDRGYERVFSAHSEARNHAYALTERRRAGTRIEDVLTEDEQ